MEQDVLMKTMEMNIPRLLDGESFFVCSDRPGEVFACTEEYNEILKTKGTFLREITWEQAVIMLNSGDWLGKKCRFSRIEDPAHSIPVIWEVDE